MERAVLDSQWIPVGKVAGPFSVNGWFWLFDYGEVVCHLRSGLCCCLKKEQDLMWSSVLSWVSRTPKLRVLLDCVSDRSSAQSWIGADFMIRRCDFSVALEGEYYWVDLLDLPIENTQGHILGRIGRIVRGAIDDFFEVHSPSGIFLIPARLPFFSRLDTERSVVVVDWHADDL